MSCTALQRLAAKLGRSTNEVAAELTHAGLTASSERTSRTMIDTVIEEDRELLKRLAR